MPHSTFSLFALPDALLGEVVSWIPDASTANALLKSCRATRQLRHDATAAALLLMRCTCTDCSAALASCGAPCHGGTAAVVQQVLQLVGASSANGGPYTAPQALLEALLFASAAEGDAPAINALLALPQPPDVEAAWGQALLSAVNRGSDVAAVQALLAAGADPCARFMASIRSAARVADRLPALQLLLRNCSHTTRAAAIQSAFYGATEAKHLATVTFILTLPDVDPTELSGSVLVAAASYGAPALLRVLLDHGAPSAQSVQNAASHAVMYTRADSLEALLGRPGYADILPQLLSGAVAWPRTDRADEQRDTVAMLLRHGAVATPAVRVTAMRVGLGADIWALLQ